MMEVAEKPRFEERIEQVRDAVQQRLDIETDWVVFYREVLGVGGMLDELFSTREERVRFEQTEEYAKIQQAVAKLREKSKQAKDICEEATRVITVRLPKSLHEVLRNEAHNHRTSMNQLCISKLLQFIDGDLVPSDVQPSRAERSTRSRTAGRATVEVPPEVEDREPETLSDLPSSPLAIGGVSFSPYADSMTGGRPF